MKWKESVEDPDIKEDMKREGCIFDPDIKEEINGEKITEDPLSIQQEIIDIKKEIKFENKAYIEIKEEVMEMMHKVDTLNRRKTCADKSFELSIKQENIEGLKVEDKDDIEEEITNF